MTDVYVPFDEGGGATASDMTGFSGALVAADPANAWNGQAAARKFSGLIAGSFAAVASWTYIVDFVWPAWDSTTTSIKILAPPTATLVPYLYLRRASTAVTATTVDVRWYNTGGGSGPYYTLGTIEPAAGTVHRVVVVISPTGWVGYLDGVTIASGTETIIVNGSRDLIVWDTTSVVPTGIVEAVWLKDTALSAAEVTALPPYPAGYTALPNAPELHAITQVDHDSFVPTWSTGELRDLLLDGIFQDNFNGGSGFPTEGLTPETTYHTKTRARNPMSQWTSDVPVTTTANVPPPVPPAHWFEDINNQGVTFKWDTGFEPRDFELDGTVIASNKTGGRYTKDGLASGTTYSSRSRLSAVGTSQASDWTANVPVTTQLVLAKPTVTVTTTADSITLTWPPVPNAVDYLVLFVEAVTYEEDRRSNAQSPQTKSGLETGARYIWQIVPQAPNAVGMAASGLASTGAGEPPFEPSPLPVKVPIPAVEYEAPLVNPASGGLYAAGSPVPAPAHWSWGVRILPTNCGNGFGTWDSDPCADPPADARKIGSRTPPLDPFLPIVTWGYDECDPQETDEQVLVRARQNQRLNEQALVESAFATRLLDEAIDLGTAAEFYEAVSALEAELAQTGIVGVLHASAAWAAVASLQSQIVVSGALRRSTLGHTWAFGGGYVDTLDNTIVATGPITVWQSNFEEHASLDAYHNVRAAVVERAVIVGYECAAFKITVGATP